MVDMDIQLQWGNEIYNDLVAVQPLCTYMFARCVFQNDLLFQKQSDRSLTKGQLERILYTTEEGGSLKNFGFVTLKNA